MMFLKVISFFIMIELVFCQKMRPRPRPIKVVLNNTRHILPLVENVTHGTSNLFQSIIQNMEYSTQILDHVSAMENKVSQLVEIQQEESVSLENIKNDLAIVQSKLDAINDTILDIVPKLEAKLDQLIENIACSGSSSERSSDEKGSAEKVLSLVKKG